MMPDRLLDPELSALRRLISRTRSAANKLTWQAAVQRRTTRIASVIRSLPNLLLVPIVNRAKGPEGWLVTVADVDGIDRLAVEIVTHVAARTVDELNDPIVVRVHRRDLVNIPRLEKLALTGKVTVVFAKSTS
jgi:hypothetical protein